MSRGCVSSDLRWGGKGTFFHMLLQDCRWDQRDHNRGQERQWRPLEPQSCVATWVPWQKVFGWECPQERAKLCLNQEEVESPGNGDRMGKGVPTSRKLQGWKWPDFCLSQSLCAEAWVNSIFPACVCVHSCMIISSLLGWVYVLLMLYAINFSMLQQQTLISLWIFLFLFFLFLRSWCSKVFSECSYF